MSPTLLHRAILVSLLFALCLVAGLIGGIDFGPDVAVIRQFEALRAEAPTLTRILIAITQIGSAYVTIGGGLLVAAWLAWRGMRWRGAVLAATILTERLVLDGLKLIIDRTRPTFDLHPVVTHSSSFPSGHSGNTMAIFLAIALIAVPLPHRLPAALLAVGTSLIIGVTRPYLGVHWPSDVIGGWALGAGVAIIAWTVAEARSSAPAEQ